MKAFAYILIGLGVALLLAGIGHLIGSPSYPNGAQAGGAIIGTVLLPIICLVAGTVFLRRAKRRSQSI